MTDSDSPTDEVEDDQPQNAIEWADWLYSDPENRAIVVPWVEDEGRNVIAVDSDGYIVESPGDHMGSRRLLHPDIRINWLDRNGRAECAKLNDTRLSGMIR